MRSQNGQNKSARTELLSEQIVKENLYRMSVREVWKFVLKQPPSFWFLCLYLFMEYVRPQIIYRQIDVLPFAQLFIILTLVCLLVEGKKFRPWQPADTWMTAFFGILLVTIPFGWRPKASLPNLFVPLSWAFIYFLITTVIDNQPRFIVFMLSFMLHSLKMSQHGTRSFVEGGGQFRSWGATGAPGFFQNSGEFAIQMCIFFAIGVMFFLAIRPYLGWFKKAFFLMMPMTAVISVVASSSRGGQLALAAVIAWLMMKALTTKHRAKALGGLAVAVLMGLVLIPPQQWTRFGEMGTDDTSILRLTYWRHGLEIIRSHPIFGVGYDNWLGYYLVNISREVQLPHNIFIQAAAELGLPGLFAFFGLIAVTLTTNHRTRRIARNLPGGGTFITAMAHGLDAAMVGYLVAGFFVTVLHYPFFWINIAFVVAMHRIAQDELRKASTIPSGAQHAPPRETQYRRQVYQTQVMGRGA